MRRILKSSDIVLNIALTDGEKQLIRVKDIDLFSIKFWTKDFDNNIECTFDRSSGYAVDIFEQNDMDFCFLRCEELQRLEDGILNYEMHITYNINEFNVNDFHISMARTATDIYIYENKRIENECNN